MWPTIPIYTERRTSGGALGMGGAEAVPDETQVTSGDTEDEPQTWCEGSRRATLACFTTEVGNVKLKGQRRPTRVLDKDDDQGQVRKDSKKMKDNKHEERKCRDGQSRSVVFDPVDPFCYCGKVTRRYTRHIGWSVERASRRKQ